MRITEGFTQGITAQHLEEAEGLGGMTFSYKWSALPPLGADGRCTVCKVQVRELRGDNADAKRWPSDRCRCKPKAKGAVYSLDSEKQKR